MFENRALVRKMIDEVFNGKRLSLVETIYAPYCQGHSPDGPMKNRAGFTSLVERYLTAFPNFRIEIQHIIEADDWVGVHYTFQGTNSGPLGIFPATGRVLKLQGFVLSRIARDQIMEQYFMWDASNARQQLQGQAFAA